MSQQLRIRKKKVSKHPKNTLEPTQQVGDLNNFVIRTRSQSGKEKKKMAEINTTESVMRNAIKSSEINNSNENSLNCPAIATTSSQDQLHLSQGSSDAALHYSTELREENQSQSTETVHQASCSLSETTSKAVKGKVAEMVERMDKTPRSSPVNSPDRSQQHQQQQHQSVHRAAKDISMQNISNNSACCNHDKLTEVIENLSATTTRLNENVDKLHQQIQSLQKDKTQHEQQVREIKEIQDQEQSRLNNVLDMLTQQEKKFEAMMGIMVRQNEEINSLKKSLSNMYQKQIKKNLVITGLIEKSRENPAWVVLEFFKNRMKIDKSIPIVNAYRIGQGTDRPVVVELENVEDKGVVFGSISKLKGQRNSKDRTFYVSEQLPEELNEIKRQEGLIKYQNNKLPLAQQVDMTFKKGELFVQNEKFKPPIKPPSIQQLIAPTTQEKDATEKIEIIEGNTRDRAESVFIGYAAKVETLPQVEGAYRAVRRAHPQATHVVCAFRLTGVNPTKSFGMIDDGEFGGARRLFKVLQNTRSYNRAIFVARYYGGKHIGPDRFTIIEDVGESAITELETQDRHPTGQQTNESDSWADTVSEASETEQWEQQPLLPNNGRAHSRKKSDQDNESQKSLRSN